MKKICYKFFIPMKPPTTTYQEHGIAVRKTGSGFRPVFYDTPALASARQKYIAYLAQHKPDAPLDGPVKLRTIFCFQAENTAGRRHGDYKVTKPDTDNMLKLFKDCMTKVGFWHDDAQVASEWTEKRYCNIPGVYVELQQIVPNIRSENDAWYDDDSDDGLEGCPDEDLE